MVTDYKHITKGPVASPFVVPDEGRRSIDFLRTIGPTAAQLRGYIGGPGTNPSHHTSSSFIPRSPDSPDIGGLVALPRSLSVHTALLYRSVLFSLDLAAASGFPPAGDGPEPQKNFSRAAKISQKSPGLPSACGPAAPAVRLRSFYRCDR